MSEPKLSTEAEDEAVFENLRLLNHERGTIGYTWVCNAIDHMRKMRTELKAHGAAFRMLADSYEFTSYPPTTTVMIPATEPAGSSGDDYASSAPVKAKMQ